MYVSLSIIYIYIYRERERETRAHTHTHTLQHSTYGPVSDPCQGVRDAGPILSAAAEATLLPPSQALSSGGSGFRDSGVYAKFRLLD